VPLPELLARPLFGLMWRTHLTSFPTPELDHIKYVCMVDDSRARQNLGYSPKLTLKETIAALT